MTIPLSSQAPPLLPMAPMLPHTPLTPYPPLLPCIFPDLPVVSLHPLLVSETRIWLPSVCSCSWYSWCSYAARGPFLSIHLLPVLIPIFRQSMSLLLSPRVAASWHISLLSLSTRRTACCPSWLLLLLISLPRPPLSRPPTPRPSRTTARMSHRRTRSVPSRENIYPLT